jgi:hypothetical protein
MRESIVEKVNCDLQASAVEANRVQLSMGTFRDAPSVLGSSAHEKNNQQNYDNRSR